MRVGIVDNDSIVRRMLRSVLMKDPRIVVSWDVSSGEEAFALCKDTDGQQDSAEIVLVDMVMPQWNGAKTIQMLTSLANPPICIVFSALGDIDQVRSAFQAGARGYLFKDDKTDVVAELLEKALAGQIVFSPSCSQTVAQMLAASTPVPIDPLPEAKRILTPSEVRILSLVADSYSNNEIAKEIGISVETVKTHLKAIIAKLTVANRAGAVAEGFRLGLIK